MRVNGVEADEATGEDSAFLSALPTLLSRSQYASWLDMEPFDEILNHQVYALEEERMAWEKTISEYRRTGPTDIRQLTEGMFGHERAIEYQSSTSSAVEDPETNFERERPRLPNTPLLTFLAAALPNLAEITATHARTLEQNKSVLEVWVVVPSMAILS